MWKAPDCLPFFLLADCVSIHDPGELEILRESLVGSYVVVVSVANLLQNELPGEFVGVDVLCFSQTFIANAFTNFGDFHVRSDVDPYHESHNGSESEVGVVFLFFHAVPSEGAL